MIRAFRLSSSSQSSPRVKLHEVFFATSLLILYWLYEDFSQPPYIAFCWYEKRESPVFDDFADEFRTVDKGVEDCYPSYDSPPE